MEKGQAQDFQLSAMKLCETRGLTLDAIYMDMLADGSASD